MSTTPRMTMATRAVLETLLSEPGNEQYGLALGAAAGLPSGTIHPILARLERAGWVQSSWEDIDPSREGRPARRYYRLTDEGAVAARTAMQRAATVRGGVPRALGGEA